MADDIGRRPRKILTRFCDEFESQREEIATELTWQMGRPIRYSPSEVNGTLERARHMIAIAPQALADIDAGPKENFTRFVRREPLGVVLTIAAWNYPYLIAVNSVVPALMAGNAVILKHSAQTPLCAERFASCLPRPACRTACFKSCTSAMRTPKKSFATRASISSPSPAQWRAGMPYNAPLRNASSASGWSLGGCDPVYVRHDANLAHAIENVVDGAYFNSGQSCCGLQRIYVHERIYDAFVEGFVELTRKYVLGNPLGAEHDPRSRDPYRGRGHDPSARSRHRFTPAAKPAIDESAFSVSQIRHVLTSRRKCC